MLYSRLRNLRLQRPLANIKVKAEDITELAVLRDGNEQASWGRAQLVRKADPNDPDALETSQELEPGHIVTLDFDKGAAEPRKQFMVERIHSRPKDERKRYAMRPLIYRLLTTAA